MDSAKRSSSIQNNIAVEQSSYSIDSTTYVIECFNDIIPNGERIITKMENALVQNGILINTEAEGYKDLFFKYIAFKDFGLYNTRDIHKGEALYFEKKLQLATIIQKNRQLFDTYQEQLNLCLLDQSKKEEFQKSSLNMFIKTNNEVVDFLINGDVTTKYSLDTSLVTILEKEYPVEYFSNRDLQYMMYLTMSLYLKTYTEEEKETEYISAKEAIEDYKNDLKKQKNKVDIPEGKNSTDRIEVIEFSEQEATEYEKNGGIIEETISESDDNE
ncbi:hypothetical protein [Aquimarina longa]|uniref:hypothetical protein n=1 Tax=Aquimarina longa TaxID=1080221 RepID=UPI000786554C|nr:hypothetical protein [Aquimarina longa]